MKSEKKREFLTGFFAGACVVGAVALILLAVFFILL